VFVHAIHDREDERRRPTGEEETLLRVLQEPCSLLIQGRERDASSKREPLNVPQSCTWPPFTM
jgi:hypothetical protein